MPLCHAMSYTDIHIYTLQLGYSASAAVGAAMALSLTCAFAECVSGSMMTAFAAFCAEAASSCCGGDLAVDPALQPVPEGA